MNPIIYIKRIVLITTCVFFSGIINASDYEALSSDEATMTVKASGKGQVQLGIIVIRNGTNTFIVNEGDTEELLITSDTGYRVKSLLVNNKEYSSGQSNIRLHIKCGKTTNVEVTFEAIPPTYSLSIKSTGNGSVSYDDNTIRNNSSTFTVDKGTSAIISISADNGYRIKSVKVNSSDVTAGVSNNKYTVSNIQSNTTVEVEFEAIPPTTYTLSIKATGNGSASYDGNVIRSKTSTFTVNESSSATISFSSDNGYRIKSVKVNNTDVTSSVSNNSYTISSISSDTNVEVEFEAIPVTTYTLSIKATGNGSASYDGNTIRGKTSSFTVNEGSSVTITFNPDNGYRIKSVKEDGTGVTSYVSNGTYSISVISKNTSIEVEFEAIPPTTYTLSVSSTGSGYASYDGTTIRSKTSSFTVNEGTNATISFSADNGYRIKSVKVNNSNVTSSVSNNQYTVSNIQRNTTVEVEFEAIPPTTYTLTISSTGSGYASYDGTTIRSKTSTFTVNEGTNATISFSADNGYRIKSVKVNNSNVTSSVSNNQYTVSNIQRNIIVEVEFEAIPPKTYTLTISSTGSGYASYDGNTIRSKTSTFTVNEGTNATISFSADNGYRIKSVKVNSSNVTSSVSNNQYTVSNIQRNTTVEVEFEINSLLKEIEEKMSEINKKYDTAQSKLEEFANALKKSTIDDLSKRAFDNNVILYSASLSVLKAQMEAIAAQYNEIKSFGATDRELTDLLRKIDNVNSSLDEINKSINDNYEEFISISNRTYTLSIKATGNGSASYDGNTIRGKTSTFTVNVGSSASISFSPDNGYRVKSVKVNSSDVTSNLSNNKYTISNINKNTTVEVEFQEELKTFTSDGLNYAVLSYDDKTVNLANGKYGTVLEVPATITYQDITWKVAGIDNAALANNEELAAIIWNPSAAFTVSVSNPNLLLYVKSSNYAPATIQNVVVNSTAESIVLTDAASGNNYYCPKEFTAKKISYTHNYGMITGLGESRGWETIALPFDVKKITHSSKGELTPFANWRSGDSKKPFWLMSYGASGWANASSIKANTPYIISMPNNPDYKAEFRLSGNITFSAENVTVKKSDNLQTGNYGGNTFTPNFSNTDNSGFLALNVNNDYVSYSGGSAEGSTFVVNLRAVHPFEAYMTSTSKTRSTISINGDMATGIEDMSVLIDESKGLRIYNLKGQLIKVEQDKSLEEVRRSLPAGVYIVNGKKLIIK